MIKDKRSAYILIGVILSMAFIGSGAALAADCKVLHDAIHKERVLLRKKSLVDAALKVCPNDPEIVYDNGYIFERFRKYEEALLNYRKAIALDSAYSKAYFSIGDIEALQNNYSSAVEAYTEGLRLDPDNARARGSLKVVLAKKREENSLAVAVVPPVSVPPVSVAPVSPVVKKKKAAPVKTAVEATPNFAEAPITRLNVPFRQKSGELSQDAQDVLSVVVGQAMNRKDMQGKSFEVGGHTDNLEDTGKNYAISKKRAVNVKKYLTEGFAIDSKRLKLAYHGSKKPKVPNTSPANQAINRRVDFSKLD